MSQPAVLSKPAVEVRSPVWLTVVVMAATVMQVLDTTIANIALPQMTAGLSASQEEITWVLTSYIVAAAIATPLTGWATDQLGRRTVFALAIAGFTLASLLCGIATSLEEMVLFRILQGIFGAVLMPLAQTVILDINPREKMGQAMAIYGAGIMVGPIIGPTLGGWLTETFNWRFVFLVNLPVGILSFIGILVFLPQSEQKSRRFDMFGFAMLALAVGALQLLLDRGETVQWFDAIEIWIYLGLSISGLWVFIVHCWTAADPFVDLRMFRDRNYFMGLVFMFIIGITLFSGLALLPPLLQRLMGYPVIDSGLIMAPRGVGTLISMIFVGRLVSRYDPRALVLFGIVMSAWSLWMMTGFDLMMDSHPVIVSGFLQGFGLGFVFVPLTTLAFATIAPQFRADATSFFSLVRNIGSGVGISLVTATLSRMSTVNHEELASRLTAAAPQVQFQLPALLGGSPLAAMRADQLVSQQAAMIAYVDNFLLMLIFTLATLPIALLLRRPANTAGQPGEAPAAME